MNDLRKIVSGGQTGVDRAALDASIDRGFSCGGWCPRGRRAEDGRIPAKYPLKETPSTSYSVRTEWNVRDSDATLILSSRPLLGGTQLTLELAKQYRRPSLVLDAQIGAIETAVNWLSKNDIRVLNVAGPRESESPGVYSHALRFLTDLLCTVRGL